MQRSYFAFFPFVWECRVNYALVTNEINGAASFNNLGPMLSKPVDFVRSIFFRYFSTFSQEISGIEK